MVGGWLAGWLAAWLPAGSVAWPAGGLADGQMAVRLASLIAFPEPSDFTCVKVKAHATLAECDHIGELDFLGNQLADKFAKQGAKIVDWPPWVSGTYIEKYKLVVGILEFAARLAVLTDDVVDTTQRHTYQMRGRRGAMWTHAAPYRPNAWP